MLGSSPRSSVSIGLEKRRREGAANAVNYVSICSPNYLHDAHVRLALRVNAHAICEKPLVINPWNLDQLQALEQEYDTGIRTVLQLRHLPAYSLKPSVPRPAPGAAATDDPVSKLRSALLSWVPKVRRAHWIVASYERMQ
jgi:predicted metal-dependent hydrolase